ncbi:MAG: hypothetical protein ABIK28_16120, partial [Planctomycetota bacterium]
MKVFHVADQHVKEKEIEECRTCLGFIVETAREASPDLIVSAGDWFDSQDIKLDSQSARLVIKTVSDLANIAPVVIILGTKSHDGNAPEILSFCRGIFQVWVTTIPEVLAFREKMLFPLQEHLMTVAPQAVITLIPQLTKQYFRTDAGIDEGNQQIANAMTPLFAGFGAEAAMYPDVPHIVVWHGGITGAKIPSGHVITGQDIEISTDQIRIAGGDREFLGAFYPGPIYPVKVDETECGFWIHDIQGAECLAMLGHIHQRQVLGAGSDGRSIWVETPCRKVARFKVDFTEDIGVERDFDLASDGWADSDGLPWVDLVRGQVVRMELTVSQDDAPKIDKAAVEDFYLEAGAISVDIKITRIPRENIRATAVLEAVR